MVTLEAHLEVNVSALNYLNYRQSREGNRTHHELAVWQADRGGHSAGR